ncbi:MAG: flavin reductase [Bacteroidia bacterium]|nr:flavin reductase [Bacteroidia bacterium]
MSIKHYTREEILEMPKDFRRNFINCLSGYKPVCLCGTINLERQTNLAIISNVLHVGAHPPLIGILLRPHVVERHTVENIDQVGYFTLNNVSEDYYKAAHQTSARYPREESEFKATGLNEFFGERVPAPYVKEASLKMGFRIRERVKITTNATIFMVGQLEEVFLPEEAIGKDGFLFLEKMGSIVSSGLDRYHRADPIARLSYAKTDRPIKEIE